MEGRSPLNPLNLSSWRPLSPKLPCISSTSLFRRRTINCILPIPLSEQRLVKPCVKHPFPLKLSEDAFKPTTGDEKRSGSSRLQTKREVQGTEEASTIGLAVRPSAQMASGSFNLQIHPTRPRGAPDYRRTVHCLPRPLFNFPRLSAAFVKGACPSFRVILLVDLGENVRVLEEEILLLKRKGRMSQRRSEGKTDPNAGARCSAKLSGGRAQRSARSVLPASGQP